MSNPGTGRGPRRSARWPRRKGIKLHPRAEQFTLDHPDVPQLFALADERTLPILIHAGRGIPALGEHVIGYAREYSNARVILAHAAVSDLGWIWRACVDLPNVLFDTAWWISQDLAALFTLVPPAQIVFASDAPYGMTGVAAASQLRLALQSGLTTEQVALIASGQSLRIANGEPLAVAGPAVGERDRASHLLLDRVANYLQVGALLEFRTGDGTEMVALAELACDVPEEIDDFPVFAAIAATAAQLRRSRVRPSRKIGRVAACCSSPPRWRCRRTSRYRPSRPTDRQAPSGCCAPRSGAGPSASGPRRPRRSCP